MIHFLTTKYHLRPIRVFLQTTGKAIPGLIRPVVYNRFVRQRHRPAGTYVFADIDRLSPRFAERLAAVWNEMSVQPERYRLLNHPTLTLTRYPLLRRLHTVGLNDFTGYRADGIPKPARFPVFIRREDDHAGSRSDLIHDQAALEATLAKLAAEGVSLRDKIVTELCGTPDEKGRYYKFGATVIGTHIIPNQCHVGMKWMVKYPEVVEPDTIATELEHFRKPAHIEWLQRIVEESGVQFGRIDYGIADGRPQCYEINTNPVIAIPRDYQMPPERAEINRLSAQAYVDGFRAIDTGAGPGLLRRLRERIR